MALERARQRKFTELVTNHVLGHVHRHVLLTVVYSDRQANKIWHDCGTTRPCLDWLFVAVGLSSLYFFKQVGVAKRPFLMNVPCLIPYFLPRRETIIEVVRLLRRVFLPLVC